MITVSAAELKQHLFEYLDKVADGEMIAIQRNNHDIAYLIPKIGENWRDAMQQTLQINVTPEELIQPL